MSAAGVLEDSYAALVGTVRDLPDEAAWAPTGCRGWTVRDLVHHLTADARRALVAVHTPVDAPPDCDDVAYWRGWGNDPERDEQDRRLTRVEAGLHSFPALRASYVETAEAARTALAWAPPDRVVGTQGHALRVADLASTLAVEAALHHLDLVAFLDAPGPPAGALAEVRRVVTALLGRDLPGWSDERVALVGTGRAEPTPAELADLGGTAVPAFS